MNAGELQSPAPGKPGIDVASLLDPACYPHPVAHLQLRETPTSWVVLTGPCAYKVKKPVHLDFIDAATLPRRRFLCEEELRLNRRFAPDLYRDVVPISLEHGRARIGAPGSPVEYAVRMQQFDPSQELASLLAHDRVTGAELAAFGTRLAQWHQAAAAAQAHAGYGAPALVRAQALENFTALRRSLSGSHIASNAETAARLPPLERWTTDSLGRLEELMARRERSGRVRECHGDLHSGNLVRWDGQLLPFDCLEFEPRLRWIDVISDVAFLFMDLLGRTRTDLAHAFLSAYLEQGGDYEGLRLLAFYGVYRALVRAKIDALALAGHAGDSDPAHRQHLEGRLRTAARLTSGAQAALVLMHGVTASGKSWIAERLIGALPAIRVRSDLERQRLAAASQPAQAAQRYCAGATEATYSRVLECAASALESGQSVVVDATFLDQAQRHRFEALAGRLKRPWLILSCTASRTTLLQRLAQRARHGGDPSEATGEVLDQQLQALQPLPQSERAATVQINMDAPVSIEALLPALRRRLGQT